MSIPVGPVPFVAEPGHQLGERPGSALLLPARPADRDREAKARDRRDDHVERIGRVAAVSARVGQRTDQVDEVDDRARVTVPEDEGHRTRLRRPDVDEMDRLAVDLGRELGIAVERCLLGTPVEVRRPIPRQIGEVFAGHAPLPARGWRLFRETCSEQTRSKVGEIDFGDVDAKWSKPRVVCHL